MTARLLLGALALLLAAFLWHPQAFAPAFAPLTRNDAPAIYTQTSLLFLTLSQVGLVAAAALASGVVGVGAAVFVTRPEGADFLPLARAVVTIGQTFPPVAVLALAVPVLGFGTAPTLAALFLYGLLPVFESALAGLTGLPAPVRDAARAMGMTRAQRLWQVELPLALPLILSGLRLTTIIALGTATIGSTIAAKTLGEVIIAGLLSGNTAFVLQGGLCVGALAVLVNAAFLQAEAAARVKSGQTG